MSSSDAAQARGIGLPYFAFMPDAFEQVRESLVGAPPHRRHVQQLPAARSRTRNLMSRV